MLYVNLGKTELETEQAVSVLFTEGMTFSGFASRPNQRAMLTRSKFTAGQLDSAVQFLQYMMRKTWLTNNKNQCPFILVGLHIGYSLKSPGTFKKDLYQAEP